MNRTDQIPTTLSEALAWAEDRLESGGVSEPRPEAMDIWARVTDADLAEAFVRGPLPVPAKKWKDYRVAVERRAAGEPIGYATGVAGFRTLDLRLDRRVLIPRPETEGLVRRVLRWAESLGHPGPVADIGTGSGCVALSLAVEGRFSRVVATDVSPEALTVAEGNVARVRPATPVDLRLGAFFEPLEGEVFAAVVSNPPYVTREEFEVLDGSVRLYEPGTALVSGEDGMWHTRVLLESARDYLMPGGLLALEVDSHRAAVALEIAGRSGWDAGIQLDRFGRPRYLLAHPLPQEIGRQ